MRKRGEIQRTTDGIKMIFTIEARIVSSRISQTLTINTTIKDIMLLNQTKATTIVDHHPIITSPMINQGTLTITDQTSNRMTTLTHGSIKEESLTIKNPITTLRNRILNLVFLMSLMA